MMMRLPVVATNVGAVSELVEDGVTGVVVPPLDPRALAQAILQVADPPTRMAMGAHARERALNLCSTEKCAQVHLEAYDLAVRHRDARLNGGRWFARAGTKDLARREGDL
jgi:glycosyltransferase involved in cell wall biosynthesis